MERNTEIEMLYTHCCRCGYRISKSAPGTKSLLTCPKCGSDLEVSVDGKAVKVTLLRGKGNHHGVAAV